MLRFILFYFVVSILILEKSLACATNGKTISREAMTTKFKSRRQPADTSRPRFSEGGGNVSLEAKLGNLLLDNTGENVVLSIPAVLLKSDYHPFGDGQSNAILSLGGAWNQNEFPVIGIQKKVGNGSTRTYVFHSALKIISYDEKDIGQGWYQVTPKGYSDSFYFNFDTSALLIRDFLAGIPAPLRTFSEARLAPDPEKIGVLKSFEVLKTKTLGSGYNSAPWFNDNVHGLYPDASGKKTAIGGVYTWGIVDTKFGPFKQLYTCFESRNLTQEKQHGVPSGAGWHHIGDSAESIINNLEKSALPVAIGRTHGKQKSAYGLTDSITAVWLKPGEVLISEQNQFHWYINPYQKEVCTEIWVHNCVPNPKNHWGFGCE
jgi:hypothetical protein